MKKKCLEGKDFLNIMITLLIIGVECISLRSMLKYIVRRFEKKGGTQLYNDNYFLINN